MQYPIWIMCKEGYTYKFKLNEDREQLQITSVGVEDWVKGSIHEDYLR